MSKPVYSSSARRLEKQKLVRVCLSARTPNLEAFFQTLLGKSISPAQRLLLQTCFDADRQRIGSKALPGNMARRSTASPITSQE